MESKPKRGPAKLGPRGRYAEVKSRVTEAEKLRVGEYWRRMGFASESEFVRFRLKDILEEKR